MLLRLYCSVFLIREMRSFCLKGLAFPSERSYLFIRMASPFRLKGLAFPSEWHRLSV